MDKFNTGILSDLMNKVLFPLLGCSRGLTIEQQININDINFMENVDKIEFKIVHRFIVIIIQKEIGVI